MPASPDQLIAFAALVDHGSVTAAARALGISQPAVSGRLRSLQTLSGRPLYTRSGSTLELTAAGEAVLPHARSLARSMARAESALDAPVAGELVASIAFSEAAVPFVVPRLAKAAIDEPSVALRVVPCDASSAVGAVIAGDVDLAVAVAAPEPPTDDLERRPLLVDDIVLVRDCEQEPVVQLADLSALTVLWQAPGSGVRATAIRVLEDAGVWPHTTVELGSTLGVLAAVASGYGAGLLPRRYVQPWISMGAVTAATLDATELYARFELISPPTGHLTVGARTLYDALQRPIEQTTEAGL
ncbi:MAG: LysR family transcriptional regulator [Gaiellaceae bacterium]